MIYIANSSTPRIPFLMVDSTDRVSAETGLTPSVSISKNGGSFSATTNSATETGLGWYYVDLTDDETDTDGPLIVHATGSGAAVWREYMRVGTVPGGTATVTVDATLGNEIADYILKRNSSNIEASSDGDTIDIQSLYGMIAVLTHKTAASGGTHTVYKSDGTTPLDTRTITTNSGANPIVEITPD
jgi:hypothetical protein